MPWLLVGDINETKSLDERDHGGDEMRIRCTNFTNFIENNAFSIWVSWPEVYMGEREVYGYKDEVLGWIECFAIISGVPGSRRVQLNI